MNLVCEVTKEEIEILLQKIKKNITFNGYLVLSNRGKNMEFCKNYAINSKILKNIINKLKVEDFSLILPNEHPGYENEKLYVFAPKLKLIDLKGQRQDMQVYLKINYIEVKRTAIVVSFHEALHNLEYMFI